MTLKPLFYAGLLSLLTSCTSSHLDIFPPLSDPSLSTRAIPVAQLHEDIDAFYQGVSERHPGFDRYADVDALEQMIAEMKQRIDTPMNRVEFYREVGQLSYAFNDGHAFLIWPYQELNALRDDGHMMFPFEVEVNADGLFLKHSYQSGDETVDAGTRILSINDIAAEELVEHAQKFVGGETWQLRHQVVASRLPIMLWSLYGFMDEFELEVEYDGQRRQLAANQNRLWAQAQHEVATHSDYSLTLLNDSTAYLYVGSFDVDVDDFETFIDDAFETINSENVSSLVIDIRENGGGNTDSAEYLTRYLADRPFRMVSEVQERLNTDNRGWFDYKGNVGDMVEQPWNDWVDPIDESQRFSGDTYLLISQLSYSSAIVFATTLKDHGFATLIGQETGGFANQTAQGNLFNLPNSELRAYVATRLLVRPNGDTSVHGVIPHVTTEHNEASLLSQQDTELNAALALINAQAH